MVHTLAERQGPLLSILWPPSELGKRACIKVLRGDVILRLSTPIQTFPPGIVQILYLSAAHFRRWPFPVTTAKAQTLQSVLVRKQPVETVQLASALHSGKDREFYSADPNACLIPRSVKDVQWTVVYPCERSLREKHQALLVDFGWGVFPLNKWVVRDEIWYTIQRRNITSHEPGEVNCNKWKFWISQLMRTHWVIKTVNQAST